MTRSYNHGVPLLDERMYFHSDGELHSNPETFICNFPDASKRDLTQVIMLAEKNGEMLAHLVSSKDEAHRISESSRLTNSVGDPKGDALPTTAHRPTLTLGGDYPGLFMHLVEFQNQWGNSRALFDRWEPRPAIALAPSRPEETHGIFGVFSEEHVCRVFLYPSRVDGFALLNAHRPMDGYEELWLEKYSACIENSPLPRTRSGGVIELSPDLAKWLVEWYALYYEVTKVIK
ncbi:MAG: hypothetical protein WC802_01305 [Patescibacteria group bacterium]|jgi:hypothetical protein